MENYDVEPFLLLPPVLDLRLLFRKLFRDGAHLLSSSGLVGAGIALQGLITQVVIYRHISLRMVPNRYRSLQNRYRCYRSLHVVTDCC